MADFIIAHDVGTSSDKAVLVDFEGHVCGSFIEPYEVYYREANFAEQNPEDWWNAVCKTTRALIEEKALKPESIRAITFSTQLLGIVPIKGGKPLRNAIIWLDARATEQAAKLMRKFVSERLFAALSGAALTGKDGLPKLMWLKEKEPETYENMETFVDTNGYLLLKATGNVVMELSCASAFGIDIKKKEWMKWLFKFAGIDPGKLPPIGKSIQPAGYLTREAAVELGLLEGTPVFPGGGDAPCAAVGVGAVLDGEGHIYLGTSGWVAVTTGKAYTGKHGVVVIHSVDPEHPLLFAETETAGYCLKWIKDEFYRSESADATIANVYALMDEDVERIPAGSDGILFTPWMYGERAPVNDCLVRSSFFNITASHRREHLLRAVYEGVCYNLRWIIEIVEKDFGFPLKTLKVLGGGARGDVWMQILADVTGRNVETVESPQERGAVGAAFCALIGLGVYRDFSEIKSVIKVKNQFTSSPQNREVYNFMYRNYKSIYKNTKNICHEINKERRIT